MKLRFLASLLVAVAAYVPSPAAAAPDADVAAARRYFKKAELAYRQRNFRVALRFYKQAQKHKQHPALVFNVAQCHRQLKQWEPALFYYKLYLSELPNASNRVEVKKLIRVMKKLADEAKRLRLSGRLSVVSRPPGAQIRIDSFKGPSLGTTPAILRVTAGSHLVQLKRPGYKPAVRTVTVKAGDIALIVIPLEADRSASRTVAPPPDRRVAPPPRRPANADPLVLPPEWRRPAPPRRVEPPPRRRVEPPPPRRVEPPPPRRVEPPPKTDPKPARKPFHKTWWFWAGAGTTAACLILTVGLGANALAKEKDWQETGLRADQKAGRASSAASDTFLVTGLLVGAGVTVWTLLHERWRKKEKPRSTWIVPGCGRTGCGVAISGRF